MSYIISSGEIFSGALVANDYVQIENGGIASDVTLEEYGSMTVYDGGVVSEATVSSGGSMNIEYGGVAKEINVDAGGSMYVTDGSASVVIVSGNDEQGYAQFDIYAGTVSAVEIQSCGTMSISGRGWYSDNTVRYDDYAIASDVVVDGGTIAISGGAVVTELTVSNWGSCYISAGVANSTVVSSYASVDVYGCEEWFYDEEFQDYLPTIIEQGIMSNTTVKDGSVSINNGGYLKDTVIESGGHVYINSGGFADVTTLSGYDATMHIASGGFASTTNVLESSYFFIEGGVAKDTVVSGNETQYIDTGNGYGAYAGNAVIAVSPGGIASKTTIDWYGTMLVNGGYAVSTTVRESGCMYVNAFSGQIWDNNIGWTDVVLNGSASKTAVSSGGLITVCSGGIVTDTKNEGYMWVSSGIADNTENNCSMFIDDSVVSGVINYAEINVYSGTVTDVNNSGWIYVYGGTVNSVTSGSIYVSGGIVKSITDGYTYVYRDGVVNDIKVVSSGCIYISSGGIANDILFDNSNYDIYGYVYIHDSGIANNIVINKHDRNYVRIYVSSGGIANNISANAGYVYVSSGGSAIGIVENGGYVDVADGAYVEFVENTFTGEIKTSATVHSKTVASDVAIENGGALLVFDGGTATGVVENGGYVSFTDGANVEFVANTISGITLSSAATIHSKTIASDVTVQYGSLYIYDSGSADNLNLNYGSVYVNSGAAISDVNVNIGGRLSVSSGAIATGVVENGGYVEFEDGANIEFLENISSDLNITRDATVHSKTTLQNITINGGTLFVYDSGTVSDVKVNSNANLMVSSGGNVTQIKENGGYVEFEDGANIEFASNTFSSAGASATVHSNTVASGVTLYGKEMHVYDGGIASDTYVQYNGRLHISGGSAESNTVSGSAILYLHSGTATANTVINGGTVYVNGGYLNDTTVSGSKYDNYYSTYYSSAVVYIAGGEANNITVDNYAKLYVSSGAVVCGIKENGGYVEVAEGANVTFASNQFENIVISSGKIVTVHSNTTALDLNLYNGGQLQVFDGGYASISNFYNGASVYIYGGTVSAITEGVGRYVYVADGADVEFIATTITGTINALTTAHSNTVVKTAVISSGSLHMFDGAQASDTLVKDGTMYVSGGVAEKTRVSGGSSKYYGTTYTYSAAMMVCNDGVANSTTIEKYAAMHVYDGGIANITDVAAETELHISQGGMANKTTVKGNVYVSSSGEIYETTIAGGTVFVGADGSANVTTVYAGTLNVSGTASSTTMYMTNGTFNVYGSADVTTMSAGTLNVSGTASNTTMTNGTFNVYGSADVTTMSAGTLNVSGTASNTTMTNGTFNVYGSADATTMSGGTLNVSGTASAITVSGGRVNVTGSADDTTVHYGASMYISSGATATAITENGGYVEVAEGAEATFAENTFGDLTIDRAVTVHQNTTAENITIDKNGKLLVYTGGIVNGATVNASGYLSADGSASEITIAGGTVYIGTDGTANVTTLNNGWFNVSGTASNTTMTNGTFNVYGSADVTTMSAGTLNVSGMASAITVSGGRVNVTGTADEASVHYGASMYISSGATATNIVENGGYVEVADGAEATFAENTFGDLTIDRAVTVHKNTTAENILINQNGSMHIYGGVANEITVSRGGGIRVYDAGEINNVIIHSAGGVHISSGASANKITANGGASIYASNGAVINEVVVNGGSMQLNGVARKVLMTGGAMSIYDGGSVNYTTMSSGTMNIYSGGLANNTDMLISGSGYGNKYVTMNIYSGGVAEKNTLTAQFISAYAEMKISGGIARENTLNYHGHMYLYDGVAENTVVHSGGSMFISGGVAENNTIHAGAFMAISGGVARNTEVGSGVQIAAENGTIETIQIGSNAIIRTSNTDISDLYITSRGAAYISGGTLNGAEVEKYGILQLCEDSVSSDITVLSGGHCYIGKDATVTGEFTIETGATILAFTGGMINFTIAGRTADDATLVNNLSAIRGKIGYAITVAADQAEGTYRLADGVKKFTDTLDLAYGDIDLSGLSLDNDVYANGMNFDLNLINGSLVLELTGTDILAAWDDGSAALGGADTGSTTQDDPLKKGLLA